MLTNFDLSKPNFSSNFNNFLLLNQIIDLKPKIFYKFDIKTK